MALVASFSLQRSRHLHAWEAIYIGIPAFDGTNHKTLTVLKQSPFNQLMFETFPSCTNSTTRGTAMWRFFQKSPQAKPGNLTHELLARNFLNETYDH
jgi:hypothetical protein